MVRKVEDWMTPRERVIAAVSHEEPDRVPIDLGAMPSTGITALAYARLKAYLRMAGGTIRVYDVGQQLAEPEKGILELFHVDVIDLRRSLEPCGPGEGGWKGWRLPDGTECEIPEWFNPEPDGRGGWVSRDPEGRALMRMPEGGYYFDTVYHPLEGARSTSELDDYGWDDHRVSDACIRQLRRRAEHLHRNTDYAVMFFGAGSVHEWAQSLRGWKGWLMDLVGRKAMAEALLDRMMEVLTYNLKRYVSALSGYVSIVGFGDDLGTQTGPQVSPRTYRDMLRHHHEALFGYVKRHSRLFVFLHSCGSIYELIPDLIDAGVDILNPVQISARGMEPERLKKSFGEQITFWGGGVDTQRVFAFASPEAVAGHVRENVRVFAPGGGYVFNQVHNIQAKVPPENVVAAFEEAYEHGRYPISRM